MALKPRNTHLLLTEGGGTGAQLADGFLFSNEFTDKQVADETFIQVMYQSLLGRTPSSSEAASMQSLISDGFSRRYLCRQLIQSQEFKTLCQNAGISAGDLTLTEARDKYPKITAFVLRFYTKCLGRSYDVTGLNEWVQVLADKKSSGVDISYGFFGSKEILESGISKEDYIQRLYETILGRSASSSEIDHYIDYWNTGFSYKHIIYQFVFSDEFKGLCQEYGISVGSITLTEARDKNPEITKFVQQFYNNCLDRSADADGLNDWCANLLDGSSDGADLAHGFIFSDEFKSKNLSDEDFLTILYRAILGREPDKDGLQSWIKVLDNGMSRYFVCSNFINSPEFQEFCSEVGISKGSLTLTENRDQNEPLTGYITHIFNTVLDRKPTADELNDLTGKINGHQMIAEDLAVSILLSDEYKAKGTSDSQFVQDLYLALLRRNASESDIATITSALKNGKTREQIIKEVIASSEFKDIASDMGILIVRDGWVQQGDSWYFYRNGSKLTGWYRENGYRYYLNPAKGGAREVGWEYVDGYKLYFNYDGQLVQDVEYLVGKQDSYFIKVYKPANYVIIFAKDGNNGYTIPVKAMICSCGNPTPTGDYYTPNKFRWLTMVGGSKAQWCTQILGDYLFHSVPYRIQDNSTLYTDLMYNLLGTTQSLGCIRLRAGDAKWIYDNCSLGTHVNIDPNATSGPFDKPAFEPLPSWHTWDPTDPTASYLCAQHGCH